MDDCVIANSASAAIRSIRATKSGDQSVILCNAAQSEWLHKRENARAQRKKEEELEVVPDPDGASAEVADLDRDRERRVQSRGGEEGACITRRNGPVWSCQSKAAS